MKLIVLYVLCFAVTELTSKGCIRKGSLENCSVQLSQQVLSKTCQQARLQAIYKAKEWFNLRSSTKDLLLFPKLNQTRSQVILRTRFDDIESKWFQLYYSFSHLLNITATLLYEKKYVDKDMSEYQDYKEIYDAFINTIKSVPSQTHFSLPNLFKNFKDVVEDNSWMTDDVFVQKRLAGTCPYFVRKITEEGRVGIRFKDLKLRLNMKFSWNKHLSKISQRDVTIDELVHEGSLYVLYHEDYKYAPQVEDILDVHPHARLRPSPSPIVIMLLNNNRQLKMAAIQVDDKQDSKVVVPSEGYVWLQAKGFADIADMAVCQLKGHLLETHATQEILCILFQRNLSPWHPLYQVMFPHCEGTIPVGFLGVGSLINENAHMHKLFNVGHQGTIYLVNKWYKKQRYWHTDYERLIKRQGLNDANKIPYYPFRDDGKIIWNAVKTFARKYTKLYYKTNDDIINDVDLQRFVGDVSSFKENGGKYKGFPRQFTRVYDVIKFLTRFIWLPVQHSANSYPLVPYSAYTPAGPTKLYKDNRTEAYENYVYDLPNAAVVINQDLLTFTLASFRLNCLFDYAERMKDNRAVTLVRQTYDHLNSCIQSLLEERNKKRFKEGYLTYQYMEPKFIPNSIHN